MRDTTTHIGEIIEALPNAQFKVKFIETEKEPICHLSGKMRINHIRCSPGDKVEVILNEDRRIGRIVKRK